MKKTIRVEQHFCDVCGQESDPNNACQSCGKDLCYDCQKTAAKEYLHGVYMCGSGDGLYCLECDSKLRKTPDLKYAAYQRIEALRKEATLWSADFERRKKEVEGALSAILEREKRHENRSRNP